MMMVADKDIEKSQDGGTNWVFPCCLYLMFVFVLICICIFLILYVPLHRTGVDGMEQAINDWASELNFIQVYITICDMCICVTLHTDRGFI